MVEFKASLVVSSLLAGVGVLTRAELGRSVLPVDGVRGRLDDVGVCGSFLEDKGCSSGICDSCSNYIIKICTST